jgi:HD-GYP domain-containing protein (c-di-GMP phosphodiesterase class II)
MTYLPVPLERLSVGQILPVDIRAPDGRLLLRRGQQLLSEAHREMLGAHRACMTETDALAWQKAHERQLRELRNSGVDMADIATSAMPSQILETDFTESRTVDGGWLDLQENLRSLLYQGADAIAPLPRIQGIENKVLDLLKQDPDDGLFVLFQALPDLGLGYCATHALLSGIVGALTADKLAMSTDARDLLLRSALVMNIGMARPQDGLAQQAKAPSEVQRALIAAHAPTSAEILRGFGVQDPHWIDTVHWHHAPENSQGPAYQKASVHLLSLADTLVAKMAPRISRHAMSTLGAAKSLVLDASSPDRSERVAMASVLGFYPPGTYVQLATGEVAVVIARGDKATTPHVASLTNTAGLALGTYVYRDTRKSGFAVRESLKANQVNIKVNHQKIRRLRLQTGV